MNYLAHHFVITALNECLDMCGDAPEAPPISLKDAVMRLYVGYRQIEKAQPDEYLEDEAHFRLHEASRTLLYYAASTDTRSLITEVYEILDEFEARAQQYEQLRRTKTVVIDNRTSTNV